VQAKAPSSPLPTVGLNRASAPCSTRAVRGRIHDSARARSLRPLTAALPTLSARPARPAALVLLAPTLLILLMSSVLLMTSACVQDAAGAGGATPPADAAAEGVVGAKTPAPAPVLVLAEVSSPDGITVQVLEAKRVTADTVRVRLAFSSKAQGPEAVALFPEGTDPADFCLLTEDGARRLFLLHDSQNHPVIDGSLQPLRPGERRVLEAMFPAPPAAQAGRVTLRLGKLVLPNLALTQ
jgi:hypothetical protein